MMEWVMCSHCNRVEVPVDDGICECCYYDIHGWSDEE